VCRKILYTEPFTLPVGTHTVYYSAMDNAGNTAAVKSVIMNESGKNDPSQESAKRAAEFFERFSESLRNLQERNIKR